MKHGLKNHVSSVQGPALGREANAPFLMTGPALAVLPGRVTMACRLPQDTEMSNRSRLGLLHLE